MPRDWHIRKALTSSRSLSQIIGELTEEEVIQALQIESESRRRTVIIDRLILKAAELHRVSYINQLKEKYHHGTTQICCSHPG